MKRSSRHGWSLVELVDGRWQTTAVGDRDALAAKHQAHIRETWRIHGAPSLRVCGRAAGLYDANGARRDEHPTFPRRDDGARIEWPAAPPGPEGADVVVRPAPQKASA